MNDFVKYAWCFFLASLTFGLWTFAIIVVVAISIFITVKKPEWFK